MGKPKYTSLTPIALRQWIAGKLNFVTPENERNSLSLMIMEHLLGIDNLRLALNELQKFEQSDLGKIEEVVARLKNNEPIQYIFGEADFYGRKFYVDENVLIPRQETELLVDYIVKEQGVGDPHILDIGTGSGCIAVSLYKELGNSSVAGLDVSTKALDCAKKNAKKYGAEIDWYAADILAEDLPGVSYDVIVSNPPYVRDSEKALMLGNVLDYEPHLALFVSDQDPLIFYRTIATKAFQVLRNTGNIYMEINEAFGNEVMDLLKREGFEQIRVIKDLQQKDRIVSAAKGPLRP